jgi:MspA
MPIRRLQQTAVRRECRYLTRYFGGHGRCQRGRFGGYVQTIVQPGVIVDLPLSNMALDKGGHAVLDVDNLHIKADACGGDVTIRSYGYLRVSTESSHTSFAIYGDPVKI